MGIIIRQSIKSSVVNLVGIIIAGCSALFIYPLYSEAYGLIQFLLSTAFVCVPLASLGIGPSLIKFFPRFKTDDNCNQGILTLALYAIGVMFILFLSVSLLVKTPLTNWLYEVGYDKNNLTSDYYNIIFAFCGGIILTSVLSIYAANYKRIVVPQIIAQLGIKIYVPIAIVIYGTYHFTLHDLTLSMVGFYILATLLLVLYLKHLNVLKIVKPNLSFINKPFAKKILNYNLFASFNYLGGMLAFRIDGVMIPLMLDLSSNGIYAIMLFMSNVIEMPAVAIRNISSPIISACWENNDKEQIETIYKKAAINIAIPAIALFCFLWFSFDYVAFVSSDSDKFFLGKMAFLFLALAKIIDGITSINDAILVYSSKYKYNLFFILLLGIVNIILNFYLITAYGIMGAAIATCIAYFMYNSIKLVFISRHYKYHPFSKPLFLVLLLGMILVFLLHILHIESIIGGMALNIALIIFCYFPAVYFLKISQDFNHTLVTILNKIKNVYNR